MRTSALRLRTLLLLLAAPALALPLTAAAQQITYYDFNEPASMPSQVSYQCPSGAIASSLLFCFNDGTGAAATPSLLSDTFPAIIDPNQLDNPPVASTNTAVQLTPSRGGQAASLWFTQPQKVSSGFTTYFAFKITPNPASFATADGIAFVLQNSTTGGTGGACTSTGTGASIVGAGGGCIGYGGIDNSLAFEFDTYKNSWDPQDNPASSNLNNDNHIAIQSCGPGLPNSPDHTGSCQVYLNNGTLKGLIDPAGTTLADGNVHQVVINYSGPNETVPNLLQIFIDPAFVPETHTPVPGSVPVLSGTYLLPNALNLINSGSANDSALVGFTSGTGAAFEQHELLAWTFTPHTPSTQTQPLNPPGTSTVFPFGSHTYAVTYPVNGPSTSGISMVVTANTVTPLFFSQLVSGGPFTGSQCQVYDETGGNCIIYSVSCVLTATGAPVQCPTTDPTDPTQGILVKSAYLNSLPPVSPGYLQGDPFYSLITSISGSGNVATVTCAGECSVTTGQTVTIAGSTASGSPSAFNGAITVLAADPTTPNTFTFNSPVTTPATGGYLTSTNLKNIFVSIVPQRLDATTTGKTHNFSDFVVTSVTSAPTPLTITAPPAVAGTPALVTVSATSPNGTPTGSILLSVDGGAPITQPLVSGTTTFSLSGLTAGPHALSVTYPNSGVFLGNTATATLTITAPTPVATLSTSNINFGTLYLGDIGFNSVTLTNTGTGPMTVNEPFLFDVGNGDSKEFVALSLCPGTLAVGKSCSIYIAFYAGAQYNLQTAILKVNDNAAGSPQMVNLSATVINPVADVDPPSIRFGTFPVGTSSQSTASLINTGGTPLLISSIALSGPNAADFSQTNTCPASLAPGKNCSFSLSFKPTATGSRSATITITDNAKHGPQRLTLSGSGK